MANYYYNIKTIILFLLISLGTDVKLSATATLKEFILIDEEYTKFKKQGDAFFVQGEYKKALKKYYSCLEVPNFSNDEYARKQVEICEKAILLNDEAELAITKKKNEKAISYLEEIYELNKADILTKKRLKDFYANIGSEKIENGEYQNAIKAFKNSLIYGSDKQIDLLIRACQEKIEIPNENKPSIFPKQVEKTDVISPAKPNTISKNDLSEKKNSPLLKIIVGVVGGGATIYALSINSNWNTKLSALNTAKESGNINAYETAYTNALQAKNTEGLRNACVGIAFVSAATEIYLLLHKSKPSVSKFSIAPTNNTIGLSLSYKL